MSWEGFKNILLILLIAISGILTWSLWFYQPNYKEVDDSFVKKTYIQNRVEPTEIVKPTKMIYHENGQYYGTTSDSMIKKATHSVQKWKLYNFNNRSMRYTTRSSFDELVGKSGNVELVFNDIVSLSYYKNFLKIEESDLPSVEFNKIIIKTDSNGENDSSIYFVSDRSSFSVVEANVETDYIHEFKKAFAKTSQYAKYEKLTITSNHSILAPAEVTRVDRQIYKLKSLSVNNFKQALFLKPDNVKQEGDIYTDGLSILSKNVQSRTISFKNMAVGGKENRVSEEDLLQRSIDFVNGHAGWNYNYRYAYSNDQTNTFRLYMDGLPLFNTMGTSEISVRWGTGMGVQAYDRPYVSPNGYFKETDDKVELSSGEDALAAFKTYMKKEYDPKKLEDMTIGYDFDPNTNKEKGQGFYQLTPNWFYLYDGVWTQISMTPQGGMIDGLE